MEAAMPDAARKNLWFGVALALLASLPYLFSVYPQLTDYPSHLARYRVMLDSGQSPFLVRYYDFHWILAGNIGADLLMVPLSHAFGLECAGWLLGMILPPLTGLGLVAVEWTLRRRVGIALPLACVMIWSPAMGMGFYNFCLSLALALFAFAGWVRLGQWRGRWALFLPIGLVVWLCHASGWGVLGVLIFGYEWHRQKGLSAFLAPWPLSLPVVPMLLSGGAAGGLSFGDNVLAYKTAIWLKALRDQSMPLDLATLGFVVFAVLVAALARRIDGRLGWAALILGGLTIAMPRHFGGGDFADYRLIAVALMIGCLAIDWSPPLRVLLLASLPFLVRIGVTTFAWHGQSQVLAEDLRALDRLPAGAIVAGAVVVDPAYWGINPFEHAPSYATVRRDALVNSHFAIPGIHMLQLRNAPQGFVDPSQRIFAKRGDVVDLTSFAPARSAGYLWYFGPVGAARLPAGAQVLHATQDSILARLAKSPVPR
ncbi:MAG TPA: hypothetical protein VGE05_12330 [Novosphingobium sp.]